MDVSAVAVKDCHILAIQHSPNVDCSPQNNKFFPKILSIFRFTYFFYYRKTNRLIIFASRGIRHLSHDTDMEVIIGRQGTQKTAISDPTVSRRHCKVTDNGDGTYTIENLSDAGTRIDGREIVRATANANSKIQLGASFCSTLGALLDLSETKTKSYSIGHLRAVWEDFNRHNIDMAEQQRKINLTRTGLGIFTMCAMPTIFFFGAIGYLLTGIGVLGNIYSFAGMRNAETAADRQRRQDDFDDAWVCPNPDCGRSLPAKNYKMLVRNFQSCPYCKCKYTEK